MVKVVNPFNRKKDTLETNANRCDCICYSLGENHQSGLFSSKM